MHLKCQRKPSSPHISMMVLVIALSSIICRGSDVQAWTKTNSPIRIALHRNDDPATPALARMQKHVVESIPRGGDADNGNNDGYNDASKSDSTTTLSPASASVFEIIDEKIVYSGWRTILQRKVRMRNGKVVDFDLVGVKTGEGAVLVFAWDTHSKTATVIREYMPASNRILWGLAAGLIEEKHGHDTELAARHELEEECHLKGGKWIPLLTQPAAMDKYATTVIQCYLVIDPEPETNPKPLDDEEDIEIISGVTIPEILSYIKDGEMNLVGGYGSLLAIEKLRELGEYP
jgi:ADP-ribose pyrophosphatase YjhB (NUDIX family)